MSGSTLQRACAVVFLGLTLGACGTASGVASTAQGGSAAGPGEGAAAKTATIAPEAPCGAAAASVTADAAGHAAQAIYGAELASPETSADRHQVESDSGLLSAMSSGNAAAITEAVTRLVFSGTHIVRLRVTRGSSVLADVGGPYILAPTGGELRLGGRTLGHYLLSVQDDSGYVKLETRFIGLPVLLQRDGRRVPLEGTITPGSSVIPSHGPVRFHGASWETFSFLALAFPSGRLKITLLVPPPPSSSAGCASIKADELSRVAHTAWNRFNHVGIAPGGYITTVDGLTGGLNYVYSGSQELAGSTHPGPGRLPSSGTVSYRGRTYMVRSFASHTAAGSVRLYQLLPV
jgi:hypothetical protein